MAAQSRRIPDDDEFHAGSGDGDVHASQVAEESYLPFLVGTHEADEDNVAFLSLEPIDSMYGDEFPEGFEEGVAFDEGAEVMNLRPVG